LKSQRQAEEWAVKICLGQRSTTCNDLFRALQTAKQPDQAGINFQHNTGSQLLYLRRVAAKLDGIPQSLLAVQQNGFVLQRFFP
jgi:hypothetical protein